MRSSPFLLFSCSQIHVGTRLILKCLDSFANLVGTPEEKDGEPGPSTAVSIHPEDIRDKMMEEAEELLKKYDLMLPNERASVSSIHPSPPELQQLTDCRV